MTEQQQAWDGEPYPVSNSIGISTARLSNGLVYIKLDVTSATGITTVFFPAEMGRSLVDALKQAADRCSSALVVPDNAGKVTPIRPGV